MTSLPLGSFGSFGGFGGNLPLRVCVYVRAYMWLRFSVEVPKLPKLPSTGRAQG